MQLTLGTTGGTVRRKPPYFRTKKVAILGATTNLQYAPWHDPSWTLLAHPCARGGCQREPDWYFDLHRPECFQTERKRWNPNYYGWLKRLQTPIFMQQAWKAIPAAVAYPLEMVESEFRTPITGRIFATNHCAYMIALAMMEGVTHLGLFGCQYSSQSEHGVQRDSLIYWMGRFEQAGGKLVIPSVHNTLFTPRPLYGYASHDEHGKLIPEYRIAPAIVKKTSTGAKVIQPLTPVNVLDPSWQKAQVPPPTGEPIAWDRAAALFKVGAPC